LGWHLDPNIQIITIVTWGTHRKIFEYVNHSSLILLKLTYHLLFQKQLKLF